MYNTCEYDGIDLLVYKDTFSILKWHPNKQTNMILIYGVNFVKMALKIG